jgi:uncharacterized membrane protein YqaE (UPF0057 family)
MKLIAILLSILFPPLGLIATNQGIVTIVINIILTLLFWVPGLIHAIAVILLSD